MTCLVGQKRKDVKVRARVKVNKGEKMFKRILSAVLLPFILFPVALFFFISGSNANAANTVIVANSVITISSIDSDFTLEDVRKYGISPEKGVIISYVKFFPAAAADKMVLEEKTTSGPVLSLLYSVAIESLGDDMFPNRRMFPVLDFSDGTYTAGSMVSIFLK